MTAASAAMVPGRHPAHADAPSVPLWLPGGHGSQAVAALPLKAPAAQLPHFTAAASAAIVPGRHASHADAPWVPLWLPGRHGRPPEAAVPARRPVD